MYVKGMVKSGDVVDTVADYRRGRFAYLPWNMSEKYVIGGRQEVLQLINDLRDLLADDLNLMESGRAKR